MGKRNNIVYTDYADKYTYEGKYPGLATLNQTLISPQQDLIQLPIQLQGVLLEGVYSSLRSKNLYFDQQ